MGYFLFGQFGQSQPLDDLRSRDNLGGQERCLTIKDKEDNIMLKVDNAKCR